MSLTKWYEADIKNMMGQIETITDEIRVESLNDRYLIFIHNTLQANCNLNEAYWYLSGIHQGLCEGLRDK